jgi:predicted phosphodiesterase
VRCLVLADVHGCLAALEAVVAHAGSVDALWCLGDVVGFGPEPDACVARLRELGARCVAGNHDADAASGRSLDGWTHAQLAPESRAHLAGLPAELVVGRATLRHSLARELRPPEPADLDDLPTRLCFVGHTHVPLLYARDGGRELRVLDPPPREPVRLPTGRVVANPGGVGLSFVDPARAHYMVFDDGPRPTLTWSSVAWPARDELDRLRARGMPEPEVEQQRRYLDGEMPLVSRTIARHRAWAVGAAS